MKIKEVVKNIKGESEIKMNDEKVSVFYYKEFGYIVGSSTEFIGSGIPTLVNPVITIEKGKEEGVLGSTVLKAFEISKNALPVKRDDKNGYHYWHVSKIKSFGAFCKKFNCIKIIRDKEGYTFLKLQLADDGRGYIFAKEYSPLKMSLSLDIAEMERIVKNMLANSVNNLPEGIESASFTTVNDNVIEYTKPSDDFEDAGDGHTDAYQIYTYADNNDNYIAFLIDNPYSEIGSETIRSCWARWYGKMKEFTYQETDDSYLSYKIYGETDKLQIRAYLYRDGDSFMEIKTLLNILSTSPEQQKQINEEFKSIVSSIKSMSV